MNFQLKCRNHTDCPEDVKQAISEKVERFNALVPDTAYLEIELTSLHRPRQNGAKEAEVILDIPGVKPVWRFASNGETFIEAVDVVLDNLDEELSKFKAKSHEYRNHHGDPIKIQVADEMNKEEL
jgi:ribosomal subunit interface protein